MPTIRGACPHDCPDTCALLVTVEDGRATAIAGNPDHPITRGFLCGKVSDYLERVYHPDRLLRPLIRTGPKGEGEFREASWDEALDRVASGLGGAIDRHGGATVLPYSFIGTQGALQYNVVSGRLFNAIGATELERTICDAAAMAGVMMTHGADPEVDPDEWHHARLIVLWGWNPLSTAPHLWRRVLDARAAGARIVVIDPFRSRTARVADEHVQPIPGTDGALALGLMRAIVDAGLADEEWCRAHADGYDDLLGRLEQYPVGRCAAITGIDEAAIRALGEAIAAVQPSLVRLGVGAQRHAGAEIAYRTIACLPAVAGSWRHRGGGFAYSPIATFLALPQEAMERPDLRPGAVRSVPMGQLGRALTTLDDPPVSALVVWNANPLIGEPNETAVRAGLERDDLFCVVLEQFMTDTARYADVILPATTGLEHRDVVPSWGHHYLTWNEPAIAPRGESLPNSEIFRRIALRLGLDGDVFSVSDDDLLEQLLAGSSVPVDRSALRAQGYVKVDLGQGAAPHAAGDFATPSGRLRLRNDDLDDPLPFYDPPAEIADEALAARFGLCLITPKTHLFLNSSFANGRRQTAAQPEPYVVLHPDDAAARAIVDGGTVRVFNDRGSFTARCRVSDDARVGVAVAPQGWWLKAWRGASCQATTPDAVTRFAHAPTFNDNRVEVLPEGRHPGHEAFADE